MKAEYKRDLNRNYLVLTDNSDGFQTDMLIKNRSEGFITIRKEEWDGEKKLFYDITGKQSFERGFSKRKIGFTELSQLLYSISVLVKECRRLFLDISGILFSPEYIYRDLGDEKIYWVFYPGEKKSEDIMELAEFLLEHIDNTDPAVVKTAYELYRRAKEGGIEAENLFEILKSDPDNTMAKEKDEKTGHSKKHDSENLFADLSKTESTKKKGKTKLEQTVDKIFSLIKKKDEEYKAVSPDEFFERSLASTIAETEEDTEIQGPAPTVLLNIPDGNKRRLLSRDSRIPDADIECFPCVLGSYRECVDIMLTDKSVSRMHAQIDESDGHLFIYDLNSSNGTFVNGKRLVSEERELNEGDEIRIGNVRFVLS